ncbi:MAG TPA: Lrp/AsnC family transcriptional regulator [Steroidobacteraceae bacterium]|nr:Lrp/AsnC family transcriptional regulator [Steroidobacteraceae bacterium]
MRKKTVLDSRDRQILEVLQDDAMTPITAIAERVGLSTTPCWRRIQRLERDGVIRRRVALLDAASLNVPVSVFVAVRTNRHSAAWVAQFRRTLDAIPEIVEAYRMSGEIDYLLRVVVPDIAGYDLVYKQLIDKIEFADVTSSFSMEELKHTTALPLNYA